MDIIIIGAGTAGLTAAIYGARAGKKVLVLESYNYGGQIINATEVENYPGIMKISGFDFATGLYEQALSLGAEISLEKVKLIKDQGQEKLVVTEENQYLCKSVIIATGAKNRPLGVEHEDRLTGKGVSYCATCDGAFFKGREVAVVGGGNTALEDALFLSAYCSKVYLIHRRDSFRGEEYMVKKLSEKENVEFILNSNVTAIYGDDNLEEIEVENSITKERYNISVGGLFIAIGQMPDNDIFKNVVELDEKGYIISGEDCRTKTKGVFAAGDCRTKEVRQLATAAADGAVAGLKASEI